MKETKCLINAREDGVITIKEVNGEFVLQIGADTDISPSLDIIKRFAEYMGITADDASKSLQRLRDMADKLPKTKEA